MLVHIIYVVAFLYTYIEIFRFSSVYVQLEGFKACQYLWWPSSSLAEQKKPNQRKKTEAHDAMRAEP